MHNAPAILLGTVDGEAKKFVTSVSVHTSPKSFCQILQNLHVEANDGAFTTKKEAIDRRDELIEIDRREVEAIRQIRPVPVANPDETAATAEHRAAGELFDEDVDNQEGLDIH